MEKKYQGLRRFNLLMAVLHAVQGSLMFYFSNDFKLPVNTSYLELGTLPGQAFLVPVIEQLADLRVGPLVAIFLFLSALAHLLISLPGIYEWYVENVKKGMNPARWYEYMFSSSVMIVVIAMITGVYDLSTLLLMFSINATMIMFGHVMELHNQYTKETDWTSYIYGCFAGLIPWVVIGLYLFNAGEGDNRAPDFVYWIFFSIFLFFNSFAVNMFLQYKKIGPWKNYLFGEKVYIVMSLVAKSLLAWQVWAGTLRPE